MRRIKQLIDEHVSLIEKIDELEEQKEVLDKQLLKETKRLNRDQLLAIYPSIKSSEVKYQLFLRLKNEK